MGEGLGLRLGEPVGQLPELVEQGVPGFAGGVGLSGPAVDAGPLGQVRLDPQP